MNYKVSKLLGLCIVLPFSLMAAPSAPSSLKLVAKDYQSVLVSWLDNSDDETGFKIFRDKKLIKQVGSNITSFLDEGLSARTTYEYTVKATDNTIEEPLLTNVHINEVLPVNIDVKMDSDFYQFSDYIELRNYENRAIDISGYSISDNKTSWTIPAGVQVPANGYLLIWADKEDVKKKELHTNFKLSGKKDKVIFKDASGNTIDAISYKKVEPNIALREVGGEVTYMSPTPETTNTQNYAAQILASSPIFSSNSGFYDGSQSVALSASNGAEIYYTIDGSVPTKQDTKYSVPINIAESTVIKAVSFENGKMLSEVVTRSYLLNFNTTMPVLSLSLDSKYLFDDYIGIYVEGKNGISSPGCYYHKDGDPMNFNQDWERPVFVEYFDGSSQNDFNVWGDIAIAGQCSRYDRTGKKSFSIELKDKLKYALYTDKPNLDKIKDFKIRMGQGGYRVTDVIAAKLAIDESLNIDAQAHKAVQMFINGEYWGIYNIREKKGKSFLKGNYPDLDTKKLDIVSQVAMTYVAKSGDTVAFYQLYDFVKSHNLSNHANYQQLLEMVDIDNYIDYMALMIYSGNADWIYNNTRFWREKKDGAKWRWMLDDVDDGFLDADFDTFHLAKKTSTFMSKLFNNLLTNNDFKQAFKSRFNTLLDTAFSSSNVKVLIDKLANERRDYFDLERSKWGIDKGSFDSSINRSRNFADRRIDYVRNKLNSL